MIMRGDVATKTKSTKVSSISASAASAVRTSAVLSTSSDVFFNTGKTKITAQTEIFRPRFVIFHKKLLALTTKDMTQSQMFQKVESDGGPFLKVGFKS